MEYNKIIAVTGMPGLYELLSSKTDGAIVRSLDDKSTKFVSSRIHNFSHLESIEVYTVRDNVNLVDILKAMEAGPDKMPDDKDADALKAYFTKVYPDLDFTRVYSSDLKKMVKWFSVLKANNIEIKLTEPEEEEEAESEESEESEVEPTAKKAKAPASAKAPAGEEKKKAEPVKAKSAEKPAAAKKAAPEKSAADKKAKAEPAEKKAAAEKAEKPAAKKKAEPAKAKAAEKKPASAKATAGKPKKAAKKK